MTHYSPDILNCLANLSSDEVFTSPELANRMLDLLPQELFRSSKTRFLDPCSKSGVFLREIAKRLLAGLEEQIPDLQKRIDHIMTKQVFGIACTDLTAEMSRRTLYCTKLATANTVSARLFMTCRAICVMTAAATRGMRKAAANTAVPVKANTSAPTPARPTPIRLFTNQSKKYSRKICNST